MMALEDVKRLVEEGIPGATAEVADLTGTLDHFSLRVIAEAFRGKSVLEQHKMVQAALGEHLKREIHAVEIKTLVEE